MTLTFNDYMGVPSPAELLAIYNSGLKGVRQDKQTTELFNQKIFAAYDKSPEIYGVGKGKVSLPFKAALKFDSEFGGCESQDSSDCVSHAIRTAGMMDYCIDALFGETDYEGRLCTENIYGARGGSFDGADCSTLADYVHSDGGFLVRKKYTQGENSVDLSRYDGSIGDRWGRDGTPEWLNEIARQNSAGDVHRVRTIEEARDCLANGFGLSVCSGYSFSSSRDKNGVAKRTREGWNHAMSWAAVDDSPWAHENYGGMLFLIIQSWGRWNSGPKGQHDIPTGSFWIEERHARAMINGGAAYAICAVRGLGRVVFYFMGV